MSRIIIFGAGGRLGRLTVGEARARGHEVTAAVRDPSRHGPLASVGAGEAAAVGATGAVRLVRADATDAASVAGAAAGHDAAIASLYQDAVPHDVFYAGAARALLAGLAEAGVGRLVVVGAAVNLEAEPGVRIMDAPDFPAEYLPFAFGHTAGLHVLRASTGPVDWLMLTPPMSFDADGPRSGRYRTGGDAVLVGEAGPAAASYADVAAALVDEAAAPTLHRTRAAVAS